MPNRSSSNPGERRPRLKRVLLATTAATLVASAAIGSLQYMRADAAVTPKAADPAVTVKRLAQPAGFADLVAAVKPAVVQIQVDESAPATAQLGNQMPYSFPEGSPFGEFFKKFFEERQGQNAPRQKMRGVGSGFIITEDGLIVTNDHVVKDAEKITVVLADGSTHKATVKGVDPKTDLAVIKIDAGHKLPYVTFGDSNAVRVGEWAIAMGSPFGLGGSVSAGIISARGRDINAGPYDDFFQIDAPINRGNSGGPLFDAAGRVIGVNTAIFSPNGGNIGIGFAIPSNLAKSVVDQLVREGKVERGWLGVEIQPVTDEIAQSLGLHEAEGALVADVVAGSPAAKAGIHQGDVILKFAGKEVDDVKALARAAANRKAGSAESVTVWRNGETQVLSVTMGSAPAQQVATAAPQAETPKLGLTLAPIDRDMRERFGLDKDVTGVVVVAVAPGSPAGDVGLRPGDVIRMVGQTPVHTPAEVAEKVAAADKGHSKTVLLLVHRDGGDRFVPVKLSRA